MPSSMRPWLRRLPPRLPGHSGNSLAGLTAVALMLLARSGLAVFGGHNALATAGQAIAAKDINPYLLLALLGGLFGELANNKLYQTARVIFAVDKDSQGQIVVTHVGQGIAAVILACVKDALVFEQVLHYFECV